MAEKPTGYLSKHFFTPQEAASYIGVSRITFYRYLKKPTSKGGPPSRKISENCWRIPIEPFIEWANNGRK